MSLLAVAASTLGLGFLHGLGADHLMAIAALSVRPAGAVRSRAMRTACGFAIGHMLVLGAGVVIAVLFGVVVPAAVAAGAEKLGGALLVVAGMIGLSRVLSGRALSHFHQQTDGRERWHMHMDTTAIHPHGQSRVPAIMGAVFAVSSLRALMLLEPFGGSAPGFTLPALVGLVALFGLGILMSMSLFGVLLARMLSLRALATLGRLTAAVVAFASILLGVYWVGI